MAHPNHRRYSVKNSEQAIQLVQYLRKEGVSFWADGDNIRVHPAGLLTADHRALLKANKPVVVAYLRWYAEDMGCADAAKHWRRTP